MSETGPTAQLELLIDAVLRAVRERLGDDAEPQLMQLVVREVVAAMAGGAGSGSAGATGATAQIADPLRPGGPTPGVRAVVTASGIDKEGVVAAVATEIAHAGGDIQDISQTIVGEFFTMIMIVDISELTISFAQFKEALKGAAERLGFHIVVVHEDVMRALQRV